MNQSAPLHKITVHQPKIQPKVTTIGYGNPRYNSMLTYKHGVLLTVGSHLRWLDIKQSHVLKDIQIGSCQIFQIIENQKYIFAVNFDGLLTLLSNKSLQICHQFYAPGKQIRHSSINDTHIAISCELNEGTHQSLLLIYSLQKIEKGIYEPQYQTKGFYYYPEFCQKDLVILQYSDPNPKGRQRKQTVMNEKLPITNRIIKLSQNNYERIYEYNIKQEGQIVCAAQNDGIIYYLASNKKIVIFDSKTLKSLEITLQTKSFPHLLQKYKNGVIYAKANNLLSYISLQLTAFTPIFQDIPIKSLSIGGNLSLKFNEDGVYSLNENGLHFYCYKSQKTQTLNLFSITNCGITFNESGNMIAVADFGGSLYIFNYEQNSLMPQPIFTIFVGIPIRSIAWCGHTNNIAIGCVGGSLFLWNFGELQPNFITQINHTFNILRAVDSKIFAGTSDGQIKIFDSSTGILVSQFKAHHPVQYQSQQEKQLFGSMKNYAQIWSLTLSPNKEQLYIISSSEDQTEKVFRADIEKHSYVLEHTLKGHLLAVTSIDWKVMNQRLGQIYVSCSDDKVVRFRNPKDNFKVIFEIETSTIKQWHTLTYLSLEPNGNRVAIGSQNGYLFIYDIENRELLFGQKIHLGGIQGLDWSNNRVATCSSDLCINIIEF